MTKDSFKTAAMAEEIPAVNLDAYYEGWDDPQLQKDMDQYARDVKNFNAQYKGKLASLTPDELAGCFEKLDEMCDLSARVGVFISYNFSMNSTDTVNKKWLEEYQSKSTENSAYMQFFNIELCAIEREKLEFAMSVSPHLDRYRPAIIEALNGKPFQLTEAEEKIMSVKSLTSSQGWVQYFKEVSAAATYRLNGQTISRKEVATQMSSPDRAIREQAYKAMTRGLKRDLFHNTRITNMLALDKWQEDKLRGYPTAVSAMNRYNNIEDDVVEALNTAITNGYSRMSHRYYAAKADYLGLQKLKPWDRNAPLMITGDDKISYTEARDITLQTYKEFSPVFGAIAQEFFDNNWIDARLRKGKAGGAFAQGGAVSRHPLMFLNWTGSRRDLYTMAHEMGHNIHQRLANQSTQSQILTSTPLTLAETASVFGEKLVFEKMLAAETDPTKRVKMIGGKLDDMMNTVVRQIAFFNFELGVHNGYREKGSSLTSQELGTIFTRTQKAALGDAVELDKDNSMFWSYIPHFIKTPFYVYAYAFGECLVNALYAQFEATADKEKFKQDYTDLLKAGGTKHHSEALRPFGIDLRDPAFWEKGVGLVENMVIRFEEAVEFDRAAKVKPVPCKDRKLTV